MPEPPEPLKEQTIIDLAHYCTGLFTGMISRTTRDSATIAHGLWLLARVAENRRDEFLSQKEPP